MGLRDLVKLNRPIVRFLHPVRSNLNVVPRRGVFRRNDLDFIGGVFNELDRTVRREMERAVDNFQREGLSSFYNLTPIRCYELPIVVNEDGSRLYRLKFNLEGFDPENIKLSIKDHILTVEAKQAEEKTASSKMKCYKDLRFEYRLPKEVNVDQITSKQNRENGTLLIEAILPKLEKKEDQSIEIPIERN